MILNYNNWRKLYEAGGEPKGGSTAQGEVFREESGKTNDYIVTAENGKYSVYEEPKNHGTKKLIPGSYANVEAAKKKARELAFKNSGLGTTKLQFNEEEPEEETSGEH